MKNTYVIFTGASILETWNSKAAEFITGATAPLQCLLDRRGLLRYVPGQKRSTGRDRLYDFVGICSLALIVAMRNGKPSQGVPPLDYSTIAPIIEHINSLSKEEILAAAESGKWLVFGPPNYAPKFTDLKSWEADRVAAWFWIGWPVSDIVGKVLRNIEAYKHRCQMLAEAASTLNV